ncbi:MAG: Ig-like domain-containing protein [Peptostreptococcaceae bacterium]
MEDKFITPEIYEQKAREELENKRYRFAINEINEAIKYSTDKVQYMLIKVEILSEASKNDGTFKKECMKYISSHLNYFYERLSCEKFIEVIKYYNECFVKYDSDIIDILKSKKIPYVLAYDYSSDKVISTKEIIDKASKCKDDNKLVEALEHIRILETKNIMCRESNILKQQILEGLQNYSPINDNNKTNLDNEHIEENKEDMNSENKYKDKKKKISIGILIVITLLLGQFILYATGVIPSNMYSYELQINSGKYAYLDYEEGIAMPINEEVNFELNYKLMPFYGNKGEIEYSVDSDIVSIDENNNLRSNRFGETSLNVVRNGEIVHSFVIKVVKPSVQNISLEYSGELNYVGDVASIIPNIKREYDFGESDKVTYKSSNESVISVDEFGVIRAVGVGSAYIVVTCEGTTFEDNIIISPYVEDIKIDSNVELEVGDTHKLKVSVKTNPVNSKQPDLKFELVDNKNVLEIDSRGNIKAIKSGTQDIKITCGNKSEKITVKINKKSIKNSIVENLKVKSSIDGTNLILDLTWNALDIENEHEYEVYAKNNGQYELIDSVKHNIESGNKVLSTKITIDISDKNGRINVPIYVIASDGENESKRSETIYVSEDYKNPEDISDKVVTNLRDISNINDDDDDDYIEAIVEWDNLEVDCKYNIYVKDKNKSKYKFDHKGSIFGKSGESSSYSLGRYYEEADLEVYIVAENDYGKSKKSSILRIRFED